MEIVILDSYSTNPGDLSWDRFQVFGSVTIYENTPEDLVFERSKNADAVFVNTTVIPHDDILNLKKLKYIGKFATGYDNLDLKACKERGITVCNVPEYSTNAVAQHAFALLLAFANHVPYFNQAARSGLWVGQPELDILSHQTELTDKVIGIVGFGNIGRQIGRIAKAFGMNVLATSRTRTSGTCEGVRMVQLREIYESSDFISLNCPLTKGTDGMINEDAIKLMKKDVVIINTSRGRVVNENALARALNSGRIRGAGVDVLSVEPLTKDCPLYNARNCIITPHIAWTTKDAREKLLKIAADNYQAFLDGHPVNVIV